MQTSREPRSMFVPLLSREQVENLPSRAREIVEYRKSGLSLNSHPGVPAGLCLLHPAHVRPLGSTHAACPDFRCRGG